MLLLSQVSLLLLLLSLLLVARCSLLPAIKELSDKLLSKIVGCMLFNVLTLSLTAIYNASGHYLTGIHKMSITLPKLKWADIATLV